MESGKRKKRKKFYKSSELVQSEEERDRDEFSPGVAERFRSKKEIQEFSDPGKEFKSLVTNPVITPGNVCLHPGILARFQFQPRSSWM